MSISNPTSSLLYDSSSVLLIQTCFESSSQQEGQNAVTAVFFLSLKHTVPGKRSWSQQE